MIKAFCCAFVDDRRFYGSSMLSDLDMFYRRRQSGDCRTAALLALTATAQKLARLDARLADHPVARPWARHQALVGMVRSARAGDDDIDPAALLRAKPAVAGANAQEFSAGDLERRGRAWARIAQRQGPPHLRALVASVSPPRKTSIWWPQRRRLVGRSIAPGPRR